MSPTAHSGVYCIFAKRYPDTKLPHFEKVHMLTVAAPPGGDDLCSGEYLALRKFACDKLSLPHAAADSFVVNYSPVTSWDEVEATIPVPAAYATNPPRAECWAAYTGGA